MNISREKKQPQYTVNRIDRMAFPRKYVFIFLFTICVIRVVIWWHATNISTGTFLQADSSGYIEPAKALVKFGRFSVSPVFPDIPETVRTPGYPAFIAAVFLVFGEKVQAVILGQVLLNLVSLVLVYYIAVQLWDWRAGLLAMMLFAFDVLSTGYVFQLMSETLFTFYLLCMLAAGCVLFRQKSLISSALVIGLSLALATLTRPISYYFILPLMFGVGFWLVTKKFCWCKISLVLIALILPYFLLIGTWKVRNYYLTGHAYMSQIEGFGLLFYNGAGVLMARDSISKEQARTAILEGDTRNVYELLAISHMTPRAGQPQVWTNLAMKIFWQHPLIFLFNQLKGVPNTFYSAGDGELGTIFDKRVTPERTGPLGDLRRLSPLEYAHKWLIKNPAYFLVFLIGTGVLYIIYFGVFVYFGRWRQESAINYGVVGLSVGLVIYLVMLTSGPFAQYRFRVPLMPILALFAGRGLSLLWPTGKNAAAKPT